MELSHHTEPISPLGKIIVTNQLATRILSSFDDGHAKRMKNSFVAN